MRNEHIKTATRNAGTITDELLTRRQVADWFQCSQLTVIRLENEGKLPALRLGAGSVRYRRADLEKFLEASLTR